MNTNKLNGYMAIRKALFNTLVKAQHGKKPGKLFNGASLAITNSCMLAADGVIDDAELVDAVMAVAPWLNRNTVSQIVLG